MPQGGMNVPFVPGVYEPNSNIADLIMRAGQQRAQMQQQMYGGLANTIQQLGEIPGQIQQQKLLKARTDREEAMANMQMANLKRQQTDQASLDQAMGSGLDPDAIEARLPGHLKSVFRESWNKQQEQKAKYEKAQTELATAQSEMLGTGAKYLRNHLKDEDGGVSAATLWVKTLPKALQERAGPYMQKVQQDPSSLGGILNDLVAQSPSEQARLAKEANEEVTLSPGQIRFKGGKEVARGGPKEETRGVDAQLADASPTGSKPNPARYADLLRVKTQEASAGRDPNAAAARDATREDRSYQYNKTELDKLRKPLDDQANRLGRLQETIAQNSPQADALIAPELLTVMAGGAGSGLRMNEAEISRIIGGRSKLEDLKASLNKWSLDPSKALSITPEQRKEMRDLVKAVGDKLNQKLAVANKASKDLVNASDVQSHRKIMSDLESQLGDIGMGAAKGEVTFNPATGKLE